MHAKDPTVPLACGGSLIKGIKVRTHVNKWNRDCKDLVDKPSMSKSRETILPPKLTSEIKILYNKTLIKQFHF